MKTFFQELWQYFDCNIFANSQAASFKGFVPVMCPIFYFLTVFNAKSIDKLEEFIHYRDNERICLKPKGMSRVKYRAHSQMI